MLPYARLRPGPGFRIVPSALYYAQRLVTEPHLRKLAAQSIAAGIRLTHRSKDCIDDRSDDDGAYEDLLRDGIVLLPGMTDASETDAIVAYFAAKPVVGPGGRLMNLDALPAGTAMAPFELRTVLECKQVMRLVNDKRALALATQYLGCTPTLSSIGVRWSLARDGAPEGTQVFHRDPDDWRFLKIFIYLTDVDEESGPHAYVRGSHLTAGRIRSHPYPPQDLVTRYGADNIQLVVGPRGTAFIADTWGIHSGHVPRRAPRLILQAQYSLLPVYALLYDPLPIPVESEIDPYVNRLLVSRTAVS